MEMDPIKKRNTCDNCLSANSAIGCCSICCATYYCSSYCFGLHYAIHVKTCTMIRDNRRYKGSSLGSVMSHLQKRTGKLQLWIKLANRFTKKGFFKPGVYYTVFAYPEQDISDAEKDELWGPPNVIQGILPIYDMTEKDCPGEIIVGDIAFRHGILHIYI